MLKISDLVGKLNIIYDRYGDLELHKLKTKENMKTFIEYLNEHTINEGDDYCVTVKCDFEDFSQVSDFIEKANHDFDVCVKVAKDGKSAEICGDEDDVKKFTEDCELEVMQEESCKRKMKEDDDDQKDDDDDNDDSDDSDDCDPDESCSKKKK